MGEEVLERQGNGFLPSVKDIYQAVFNLLLDWCELGLGYDSGGRYWTIDGGEIAGYAKPTDEYMDRLRRDKPLYTPLRDHKTITGGIWIGSRWISSMQV